MVLVKDGRGFRILTTISLFIDFSNKVINVHLKQLIAIPWGMLLITPPSPSHLLHSSI